MRNLILKLINWALGFDILTSIQNQLKKIRKLEEKISVIKSLDVESAVEDKMGDYSNELEMLNNYDWDDFSQRLDNVQHLEGFSKDDFFDEIVESFSQGVQYKTLQSQINDVAHDLKGLEMNQESSDQWFQDFLNRTHEHFMRQAGSKD
tara:strand:+ start:1057 stop:1503 length:447 start_codon:yes stop_codon:yes gene_type:complete